MQNSLIKIGMCVNVIPNEAKPLVLDSHDPYRFVFGSSLTRIASLALCCHTCLGMNIHLFLREKRGWVYGGFVMQKNRFKLL